MKSGILALGLVLGAVLVSGQREQGPSSSSPGSPTSSVSFQNIASPAGLDFVHTNGASPEKHLAEIMGSGGLFFDYDNDGWIDIFLVDGGSLADRPVAGRARHRLFRNRRQRHVRGRNDEVAASGIASTAWAPVPPTTTTTAWIDLYITNVGPNVLYHNNGDGTFHRRHRRRGVGVSVVEHELRVCGLRRRRRPRSLRHELRRRRSVDNRQVLRRTGTSLAILLPSAELQAIAERRCTATTATGRSPTSALRPALARYRGNGLGVVVADFDDDGWPDVFVANDTTAEFPVSQ